MQVLIFGDQILNLNLNLTGAFWTNQKIYLTTLREIWVWENNILTNLNVNVNKDIVKIIPTFDNLWILLSDGQALLNGKLVQENVKSMIQKSDGEVILSSNLNLFFDKKDHLIQIKDLKVFHNDKFIGNLDSLNFKFLPKKFILTSSGQLYKIKEKELIKIGSPDKRIKDMASAYEKNTLVDLRQDIITWFNLKDKSIVGWKPKDLSLDDFNFIFCSPDGSTLILN